MHGHHRLDAARDEVVEHAPVVRDRVGVDRVARRLDARPARVEAVGVEVHLRDERVVLDLPAEATHRVADEHAVAEAPHVGRRV
ncbi:MAG: hypothetical protein H6724_08275 [Sandaracinus sp.]|nr:hypothetical protein [Sandaracinus sp.]